MSANIKLRHTDKGIGVNFYNESEEKVYKAIIKSVKSLVAEDVSLGLSDITWDLDNMRLGHKDPKANKILNNISLQLVH